MELYWGAVLLGAALGGFVNGLAGFGTALFALGLWLQVMEPVKAVSVVVLLSLAGGVQGMWLMRHSVMDEPRRLARFVIPALVGIPIGVALLDLLQPQVLRLSIAGLMLVFGGFFMVRRSLPAFSRSTPVLDGGVGFLGGVMGGAASLSGVLPTMWCALRPWTKMQTRAVLQPFNFITLSVTAMGFAMRGAYDGETLGLLLVALPVTMLSVQVGIAVFKRLGDAQFRWLIIGLMLVSGAVLALRELM